jgi:purine-binding chemotaxis protein CheW
MASCQYATFEVDDRLFGVEVTAVQEVISFHEYTSVPLAPNAVGGLFNLRGQVIAAVDMRVQLGLSRQSLTDGAVMNLIVRTEDGPVSLLVDRIGGVVDLDEKDFEPTPDNLTGPARRLVGGAYKLDDRLMLALNVDQALTTES